MKFFTFNSAKYVFSLIKLLWKSPVYKIMLILIVAGIIGASVTKQDWTVGIAFMCAVLFMTLLRVAHQDIEITKLKK